MDNNPNPEIPSPDSTSTPTPNQSGQFFSSANLTSTKARQNTQYFTNVQKATPGQKISNWFSDLNRSSIEHSNARKAAFKAKRDERRRAADLAAISIPTQYLANSKPAAGTSPSPVAAPAPTTAPTVAPVTAPASQAIPQSAPAPATQPAPVQIPTTVIIENQKATPTKSRKRKLLLIITAIILLLLALITTLLLVHPWEQAAPQPIISATGKVVELIDGPVPTIDLQTATSSEANAFKNNILKSTTLNVYEDAFSDNNSLDADIITQNIDQVLAANHIADPDVLTLFDIEKARVYIIYHQYDSAWSLLEAIDEEELHDSQASSFFYTMYSYYSAIADADKANYYLEKYNSLPVEIEGGGAL